MENQDYRTLFTCIDNTTLSPLDTQRSVRQFCENTLKMQDLSREIAPVAAVCVYPNFVETAHKVLENSGIMVASVAGAFPSGQSPLPLRLKEAEYAIESGADEIDMVISRGAFLEGDYEAVAAEIEAFRKVCKEKKLKVILETGELLSPVHIARASEIAMESGADFIKTSTGKIAVGATLEAAEIMLQNVKKFYLKSGKIVGFKAAGGISTPAQALEYMHLAKKIMGNDYINNQYFRIGASRITGTLFSFLTE